MTPRMAVAIAIVATIDELDVAFACRQLLVGSKSTSRPSGVHIADPGVTRHPPRSWFARWRLGEQIAR